MQEFSRELSQREQYWHSVWLENLEKANNEVMDKSDKKLLDSFNSFLHLCLLYENLVDPNKEIDFSKKVIQVKKPLSIALKKSLAYPYVEFDGFYIVLDVALVREDCIDKYFDDLDNVLKVKDKKVTFEDTNITYYVFLVNNTFTQEQIGYHTKFWDYIYF